ncbi:MAG: hypothetical protein Q9169_006820, partial [Polycauliona sp. 2 TL-2023]
VIALAMLVRKKFGVKIPTSRLLDSSTTIRHLADYIDCHTSRDVQTHTNGVSRKPFDLVREVNSLCGELKATSHDILLNPVSTTGIDKDPQNINIFLTGATGFLGIAILRNLLELRRNTNIYALVRCSSEHAGLLRLLQGLESRGHWNPAYLSRLFVIPGDLNKQHLGISMPNLSMLRMLPRQLLALASASTNTSVAIHTVIHAAAKVHYSTSYAALKQLNTRSVLFLLSSFANASSMKRFIYISGGEQPHACSSLSDHKYVQATEEDANGYTQSKVVGEQLVQFAASECSLHDRLQDIRVVKPGYMIGGAERGVANQSDFLWRLVRGCVEIGAYDIAAVGKWVFVGDVDYIAGVVVQGLDGSKDEESDQNGIEESANRSPVKRVLCGVWFEDIWTILKEDHGYTLEGMETDAWLSLLTSTVESTGEEHLLFPLLDTLEKEGKTIGVDWQPKDFDHDHRRTMEAIRKNVEYLIGVGFMPAPPVR